MKLKVLVHRAEDGGYWAEVPAIPGCMTQADTLEGLLASIREAVDGCLSVDVQDCSSNTTAAKGRHGFRPIPAGQSPVSNELVNEMRDELWM